VKSDAIPSILFYDQDFVDLYDRSWVWIEEAWKAGTEENGFVGNYVSYENQKTFNMFNSCLSSLFLNYGNQELSSFDMVDFFYSKQEEDGAIRADYSVENGKAVFSKDNPQGVILPLFSYVEYAFYHKAGNKKRLKDVVPVLEKYIDWLKNSFQKENGLFSVPVSACLSGNIPREKTYYPVDFNILMALNALYLSMIGEILNDKELSFRYKRMYFSLKTRINDMMWDPETKFYLLGKLDDSMQDSISLPYVQSLVSQGVVEWFGETVDVRPYYEMCSVYVLPSYREGTPRTVLEAMAMGRPIITTDTNGCRDTVTDGVTGFLVPVKDADAVAEKMIWFIEHPDAVEKMGEAAQKLCKDRFDVVSVNKDMLKYMEI